MEKKKHDTAKTGGHHPQPAPPQAAPEGQHPAKEAPAAGGVDLTSRLAELEQALAAKEAETAANWDKFVRERADLENYRKRTQREKEELLKYGNESLILEVLPAIDNLERALEHASNDDPVVAGVRLTLDMLLASLKKFGVAAVELAPGVPFDPAFHQAMCQVEGNGQDPNTVVQVLQKGYLLNERLLRPAMVSVAK